MTPAETLIIDAVKSGVLLVQGEAGLEAKPCGGDVPPVLLDRLRHHRDDVLATLRQPINPYRRPAHQGGAPQAVLDSLADAWDREPEDAEEERAMWEEQTGRSVFGRPAAPMLDPQQGQAFVPRCDDAPESVASATLKDEHSRK